MNACKIRNIFLKTKANLVMLSSELSKASQKQNSLNFHEVNFTHEWPSLFSLKCRQSFICNTILKSKFLILPYMHSAATMISDFSKEKHCQSFQIFSSTKKKLRHLIMNFQGAKRKENNKLCVLDFSLHGVGKNLDLNVRKRGRAYLKRYFFSSLFSPCCCIISPCVVEDKFIYKLFRIQNRKVL